MFSLVVLVISFLFVLFRIFFCFPLQIYVPLLPNHGTPSSSSGIKCIGTVPKTKWTGNGKVETSGSRSDTANDSNTSLSTSEQWPLFPPIPRNPLPNQYNHSKHPTPASRTSAVESAERCPNAIGVIHPSFLRLIHSLGVWQG